MIWARQQPDHLTPEAAGDAVPVPDSGNDHDCHVYELAARHNHACGQPNYLLPEACELSAESAATGTRYERPDEDRRKEIVFSRSLD
jgi:hypothetical protein